MLPTKGECLHGPVIGTVMAGSTTDATFRNEAMASRNPNRPIKQKAGPALSPAVTEPPAVVDPIWIVKALGATIAVAVLLGYLAVCLLVYQGGWQFLLHPSAKMEQTPAAPFDAIRFDSADTGRPRLTAWWIPFGGSGSPATVLYLHDGNGSLSAHVKALELLRGTGTNIFAIDYRGFGRSEGPHPTEARMQEDAAAAFDYLTNTRHIGTDRIVVYGEGLGAVIAANLAHAHPECALVVDTPDLDAFSRVTHSREARFLPMRLLVQEHFDLRKALDSGARARFLLVQNPMLPEAQDRAAVRSLFLAAPDPKIVVTLLSGHPAQEYQKQLRRFLEEYVPAQKR